MRSGVGVGPVENSLGDARKSDEFRLALGSGRVGPKDKHDRYYRGNAGSQMQKSSARTFHGNPPTAGRSQISSAFDAPRALERFDDWRPEREPRLRAIPGLSTCHVRYMERPPLIVSRTLIFAISSGSTTVGSADKIAKSASLPTSRLPLVASSKCCHAGQIVIALSAVAASTRCSGPSTCPDRVRREHPH